MKVKIVVDKKSTFKSRLDKIVQPGTNGFNWKPFSRRDITFEGEVLERDESKLHAIVAEMKAAGEWKGYWSWIGEPPPPPPATRSFFDQSFQDEVVDDWLSRTGRSTND